MLQHATRNRTTVVLMGYHAERLSNYARIFGAYSNMTDVLDRIVFLWNNDRAPPPHVPRTPNVPIFVHLTHSNLMHNRFNVSRLVRTPSILLLDDDLVLSEQTISRMLRVHALRPNDLIGLDHRGFDASGRYLFHKSPPSRTLVLGKTMLFANHYAVKYMQDAPLLDPQTPCAHGEDLAMNFLVRAHGHGPVVLPVSPGDRVHLPETRALSSNRDWSRERTVCVRWLLVRHHTHNASCWYGTSRFRCGRAS